MARKAGILTGLPLKLSGRTGGAKVMSKDPAFLFYPNDYLGGTMGMTFEMKGAYIDLLIFQFNNHHFTEAQAKQVLSICFASVWEVLKNKFKKDGEFYFNERLREEIDKRKAFSESRRINALHEKKPRKARSKAYAKHMGNENENENKDIIKDKILHLDTVFLTENEYQKLLTKYGSDKTEKAIDILNNAIMSKGYKYKSHYHTIIGWPMKEAQGGNNGTGNKSGFSGSKQQVIAKTGNAQSDGTPWPADREY